jgi:hypothetical protein
MIDGRFENGKPDMSKSAEVGPGNPHLIVFSA